MVTYLEKTLNYLVKSLDVETKRRNIYILKAFAAIIYKLLSKNQYYLQQLYNMQVQMEAGNENEANGQNA